jgi:hypothetical protein
MLSPRAANGAIATIKVNETKNLLKGDVFDQGCNAFGQLYSILIDRRIIANGMRVIVKHLAGRFSEEAVHPG